MARPFSDFYIPEPNSGCWLWLGALNPKGYGQVHVKGVTLAAHRRSWQLHQGQIPDGLHVLHRCDNRMCVNPDHLFLGTNGDNVADRTKKGRHVSVIGENQSRSKLTEQDVRSIRQDPRHNTTIAGELGVSNVLISMVKRRKIWRHVQ